MLNNGSQSFRHFEKKGFNANSLISQMEQNSTMLSARNKSPKIGGNTTKTKKVSIQKRSLKSMQQVIGPKSADKNIFDSYMKNVLKKPQAHHNISGNSSNMNSHNTQLNKTKDQSTLIQMSQLALNQNQSQHIEGKATERKAQA